MNYWNDHGVWFLIFMTIFPRLTLLFATSVTFGVLAWVGWFFLPRFVAAAYASIFYGESNPLLCAIAWIVAIVVFLGEGGEAKRRSS